MHTLLCVCPPSVEFLFPPVLSTSYNQISLAFEVWFSRNSSSRCWAPKLGSLTWGSEPSLQWVDFHGISVLQLVSHPPSSYGIWFYCDCTPLTISLWLLLCLCMWGIFFGGFQCLPVDDCSAVSCDSGALARGSECTSFYSAILNQSPGWPSKATVSSAGAIDGSTSTWPLQRARASPSMVAVFPEGTPKNVHAEQPRQKPQNHLCHILVVKQRSDSREPGWWERQGHTAEEHVRWKIWLRPSLQNSICFPSPTHRLKLQHTNKATRSFRNQGGKNQIGPIQNEDNFVES